MTRANPRTPKRSAFTLIEIMVVILIIAILISLLAGAAVKIMGKIPEVKTRTEIGEMDVSLGSFMADYSLANPPPSQLLICENGSQYAAFISNASTSALATQTVNFLKQWLGRSFNVTGIYDWNGDGNTNEVYILKGQQCLVFYLGGIPTYSAPGVVAGMVGFSPNPVNPASTASGVQRRGPYFTFENSRLVSYNTINPSTGSLNNPPVTFPVYIDAWQVKAGPQAYAYFSSQGTVNGYNPTSATGNDCTIATITAPLGPAFPYYQATATGGANYTNNNRYQIISAGKNGQFGGTTNFTAYGFPWSPASGATGHGVDDQANFASGLLGAGQ